MKDNKTLRYEKAKRQIAKKQMSPVVYQEKIKKLAKKFGV